LVRRFWGSQKHFSPPATQQLAKRFNYLFPPHFPWTRCEQKLDRNDLSINLLPGFFSK